MGYRQDLFNVTVSQLRNGRTQDELSEKLNEVVNACRETGKMGEITLKIKVKPDKGANGQYFLEDAITAKAPQADRGQTIMFGTPEGNLQRNDPRQAEMELRKVSDQPSETKVISDDQQDVRRIS